MTAAIVLAEHGGPEVLRLARVEVGAPGPGEIRLRQTAVGVNYHDIYVRTGLYRTMALPGVPGIEAAGIVDAIGPGVYGLSVGDRVGYVTGSYGGYAQERLLDASLALRLPDGLGDEAAAAVLVKGLTACMLLRHVHPVRAGETILVHAAAGGVGQLLCAWGAALGARVIGTAGSAEKAAVARAAGAAEVILYRETDFVAAVRDLTGGEGVAAAYDSVGADTFLGSLDCLGWQGKLVNFGQASGPVAPFAPSLLAARSASVHRPILFHYLRDRAALDAMAGPLFEALVAGVVRPVVGAVLGLAEAGRAQAMLEGRVTTGSVVLRV